MTLDNFIKSVIAATPSRQMFGKKRLQKVVYLLNEMGFKSGANFFLKDYGPFSREVENETAFMSIFGELVEYQAESGYAKHLTTVYAFPEGADIPDVNPELVYAVLLLDEYRTIELEIASTIRFFERNGNTRSEAIESTKEMKPLKTTESIILKAIKIINSLGSSNEATKNS